VQGQSEDQRQLGDVEAWAGHLLPMGSVFEFLARHRRELFPDELFADLFRSGRGRPSVPADVVATVIVLQSLHGLSDREAAEAVTFDLRWKAAPGLAVKATSFHPTTLTYWRRRLAADLTLPKLRSRWEPAETDGSITAGAAGVAAGKPGPAAGATSSASATTDEGPSNDRHRLTAEDRTRIWEQATAAAARATEQVRAAAGTDQRAAADAAWAASDFLSAAARVVEGRRGGPLTAAAAQYDRAARELWGRIPAPSQAGQGLRAASVLLASGRFVGRGENTQLLALLAQLAALSDSVTRLRENQDRAAQAAAARSAAEQLRVTSAQRTSLRPRPAAATHTRRPGLSFDAGRSRPGPAQGPAGPHRGPRR